MLLQSAAYVPVRECSLVPVGSVSEVLEIDETRDFQIISDENEDGQLMVSIKRLEYAKAWENVVAVRLGGARIDGLAGNPTRSVCWFDLGPGKYLDCAVPFRATPWPALPLRPKRRTRLSRA